MSLNAVRDNPLIQLSYYTCNIRENQLLYSSGELVTYSG